jgi:catechol 2,3-dioxygenase-like lactoylglutathione lyase family enzyme
MVRKRVIQMQKQLPWTLGAGLALALIVSALVRAAEIEMSAVKLNVHTRVHFNTNVRNFVASRAFYARLGFSTLTGFPDTNTLEMARAIGVVVPTAYDGAQGGSAGGYLLHGELIGVSGARGGLIDLIEFTIPKNDEAPYARLNHLGMTHAAMHTRNIAADYEYMKAHGVAFLSPPVTRADGSKFAMFADPDGTFYELVEVAGEPIETNTTHIVSLGHVSINVSHLQRSVAWYEMLGYEVTGKLPAFESSEVARAMGFEEKFEIDGAMLTHSEDGSRLQLVQWIKPFDPEPPYPIPVNHIGIHRMAFATTDIEADVAMLSAQGVTFLSEITPCCSGADSWGSIVAFYDPDGVIVELVEQPLIMDWLMRLMRWFSS